MVSVLSCIGHVCVYLIFDVQFASLRMQQAVLYRAFVLPLSGMHPYSSFELLCMIRYTNECSLLVNRRTQVYQREQRRRQQQQQNVSSTLVSCYDNGAFSFSVSSTH